MSCTEIQNQLVDAYFGYYKSNITPSFFDDNSLFNAISNSVCVNDTSVSNIIADMSEDFNDGGSPIMYPHEWKVVTIFDNLITLRTNSLGNSESDQFVNAVDDLLDEIALAYPMWIDYNVDVDVDIDEFTEEEDLEIVGVDILGEEEVTCIDAYISVTSLDVYNQNTPISVRSNYINSIKHLLENECGDDELLVDKIYHLALFVDTNNSYMEYIVRDDYSGEVLQSLPNLSLTTSEDVKYALASLVYVFSDSFPELGFEQSAFTPLYYGLGVDQPMSFDEAFQDFYEAEVVEADTIDESSYEDNDTAIECPTLPSSIKVRGTVKTREGMINVEGAVNTSTGTAKLVSKR
tara:strand:- start:5683 stop:6729 length:1047 start_codon:yes stop_codon:yes gene_type:complete